MLWILQEGTEARRSQTSHLAISLLHQFADHLLNLLTTEVALENLSVRTEEDNLRNAADAVGIAACFLSIKHLWVRNAELFNGFDCVLWLVTCGNAEHLKLVALVLVVNIDEVWNLTPRYQATPISLST